MQVSKTVRPHAMMSARKYFIRSLAITAEKNIEIPFKTWKEIPGPSSLPFVGPTHHFLPGGQFYKCDGLEMINKMFKTYGPIVKMEGSFGRVPMILISDPESASKILRGENKYPIRLGIESIEYYRKNWKKGVKKGCPTGLISEHGEPWKELRSAVNPVMLQPKTIRLYTKALDEIAMDMITRMKSLRDENNTIKGNFSDELNLWALESIGIVALGCRLGCLDLTQPKDPVVLQLISCVRELLTLLDKLDFKPSMWKLVATPNFKRAMKLYELQETLSKHFIKQAMAEFKTKSKSNDEKGVLEKLLDINEDFAHIMATDMLLAGIDTTANAIIPALYLLAVNPDKQRKLREQLRSNQEKRPYLKACLKESLRMMSVVTGNSRFTTKAYDILGYRIPPGIHVAFIHRYMTVMEEQYPRANEFLPERWLVEKDDPLHYGHAHPFAFNTFGFGARSCIGRRIAELELEVLTSHLVENFHVEWFGPPPKVEQRSINYVKGPLNFIFNDAPK